MATNIYCTVDTNPLGGADYTSLYDALWGEAGESPKCVTSRDLVTNDEFLIITVAASTGLAEIGHVPFPTYISGLLTYPSFVTDDTHRVAVFPAAGQWPGPVWDESKYRIVGQVGGSFAHRIDIYGLQIQFQDSAGAIWPSRYGIVAGCIVRGLDKGFISGSRGINIVTYHVRAYNNLVYGFDRGIFVDYEYGDISLINNTAVRNNRGIWIQQNYSILQVINNVAAGNNIDWILYGSNWPTGGLAYSNACSDGTSASISGQSVGTAESIPGVKFNTIFSDPARKDFRLKPTSSLFGAGVDLTTIQIGTHPNYYSGQSQFYGQGPEADFDDDLLKTVRTVWSVGAFEEEGPAVCSVVSKTVRTESIAADWLVNCHYHEGISISGDSMILGQTGPCNIYFSCQGTTASTADTATINHLVAAGHTVTVVYSRTVSDVDNFAGYDLIIIGPSNTGTGTHPAHANIQAALCSVISFDWGVSRYSLLLSSGVNYSGSGALKRMREDYDYLTVHQTPIPNNYTCRWLRTPRTGVITLYEHSTSSAYKFSLYRNNSGRHYFHFGFLSMQSIGSTLLKLFLKQVGYCSSQKIYNPTGKRTSTPIALDEAVHAKLRWEAETPAGTSFAMECAVNDSNTVEPGDESYVEVGQLESIPGISPEVDLAGKYLWVRQVMRSVYE